MESPLPIGREWRKGEELNEGPQVISNGGIMVFLVNLEERREQLFNSSHRF